MERRVLENSHGRGTPKQPETSEKDTLPPTLLQPLQRKLIKKGRNTRADRGQIKTPDVSPANSVMQHMQNAFLEYTSIVKETIKVNLETKVC